MKRTQKLALATLALVLLGGSLTSCSTVDQITGVDLDVAKVEQTIEAGILDQGGFSVVATCPDPLAGQVGDTRTCSVEDEFGQSGLVDITIQNDNGDIVWKLQN